MKIGELNKLCQFEKSGWATLRERCEGLQEWVFELTKEVENMTKFKNLYTIRGVV